MKYPIVFVLALSMCSIIILNAIYLTELKETKSQAVKRGHAYYQTDEYGNSTFIWRDEKK